MRGRVDEPDGRPSEDLDDGTEAKRGFVFVRVLGGPRASNLRATNGETWKDLVSGDERRQRVQIAHVEVDVDALESMKRAVVVVSGDGEDEKTRDRRRSTLFCFRVRYRDTGGLALCTTFNDDDEELAVNSDDERPTPPSKIAYPSALLHLPNVLQPHLGAHRRQIPQGPPPGALDARLLPAARRALHRGTQPDVPWLEPGGHARSKEEHCD